MKAFRLFVMPLALALLTVPALQAPVAAQTGQYFDGPAHSSAADGERMAIPAAPEVQEQNGISYITGGVGADEARLMKQMSDRFNLKVTLATPDGHYQSAPSLQIERSGKMVLDAPTDGPLFFAQLPPGSYTIRASGTAHSQSRAVTIPAKGEADVVITLSDTSAPMRSGDAPE